MVMSIQTNVGSLNAQRNLFQTQQKLESSLSKLSSGFRITKAGDDAAGLGVSNNLQAQIRSYNQAARNAGDGQSVVQTAEGGLNEISNILARMRELAMESASDGISDTERAYVNKESEALISEIDRIAQTAEFNGQKLLNSSATTLDFQVGLRNTTDDVIGIATIDATSATLAVDGVATDTKANAQVALDAIDAAIVTVSGYRADLGTAGNRLTNVVSFIQTSSENLSAANSRIRDVDVAEQTASMSRENVLMQAGVSVLAQANQTAQMALKLLG